MQPKRAVAFTLSFYHFLVTFDLLRLTFHMSHEMSVESSTFAVCTYGIYVSGIKIPLLLKVADELV